LYAKSSGAVWQSTLAAISHRKSMVFSMIFSSVFVLTAPAVP